MKHPGVLKLAATHVHVTATWKPFSWLANQTNPTWKGEKLKPDTPINQGKEMEGKGKRKQPLTRVKALPR